MLNVLSDHNKNIIRDVAKRQFEISQKDVMTKLRNEWKLHNDCQSLKPLVTIEYWTFYQDVIPQLLKCTDEFSRNIEASLYGNFINHTLFNDDTVVKDYYPITNSTDFKPFDIDIVVEKIEGSVGHHFVEVISDLERDFNLLKKSTFKINKEKTVNDLEFYGNLFDDVLPVKLTGSSLYAVPTQAIVHIMSMENMLMSMYDYPQLFHKMMDMLSNDYLDYFNLLEESNFLLSTTDGEGVGNGTYAYTNDLPKHKDKFLSKDIWGFMDSQETTGISPEMYEEFIFPYYKKISDRYGLLSYGCCEGVHPIWDNCLSKLDNLRKVSISPWCDEEFMGEKLRNKKIVYHRKPSPNYLGVGSTLDEEAIRIHIKDTLKAAKGCVIEFTQRDVYTLNNTYEKVKRYVEIIREEINR